MGGSAPHYDDVRVPGPGGFRYPTECQGQGLNVDLAVQFEVTLNFGTGHANQTLTPGQACASLINCAGTVDTTGAEVIYPAPIPGRLVVVQNATAQTITFLVTGKTGIAVASGDAAVLFGAATDIQRASASVAFNS